MTSDIVNSDPTGLEVLTLARVADNLATTQRALNQNAWQEAAELQTDPRIMLGIAAVELVGTIDWLQHHRSRARWLGYQAAGTIIGVPNSRLMKTPWLLANTAPVYDGQNRAELVDGFEFRVTRHGMRGPEYEVHIANKLVDTNTNAVKTRESWTIATTPDAGGAVREVGFDSTRCSGYRFAEQSRIYKTYTLCASSHPS
jgi:hypothetical protein